MQNDSRYQQLIALQQNMNNQGPNMPQQPGMMPVGPNQGGFPNNMQNVPPSNMQGNWHSVPPSSIAAHQQSMPGQQMVTSNTQPSMGQGHQGMPLPMMRGNQGYPGQQHMQQHSGPYGQQMMQQGGHMQPPGPHAGHSQSMNGHPVGQPMMQGQGQNIPPNQMMMSGGQYGMHAPGMVQQQPGVPSGQQMMSQQNQNMSSMRPSGPQQPLMTPSSSMSNPSTNYQQPMNSSSNVSSQSHAMYSASSMAANRGSYGGPLPSSYQSQNHQMMPGMGEFSQLVLFYNVF